MEEYYNTSSASKDLSKWMSIHSELFFNSNFFPHQNPVSQHSNITDDNESSTDYPSTTATHSPSSSTNPAFVAVNAVGGAASAVASSSAAVASAAASTVTSALTGLVIGTIRTTGKVGSAVINASGIPSGLRSMGIMGSNNSAEAHGENSSPPINRAESFDQASNLNVIPPNQKFTILIVRETPKGVVDVIKSLALSKFGNKQYIDCYVYDPIIPNTSGGGSNSSNSIQGSESQFETGLKLVEKELRAFAATLPSSKKKRDSRTNFLFSQQSSGNLKMQPELLYFGVPIQTSLRRGSTTSSVSSSSFELWKISTSSAAPFGLDVAFDLIVVGAHSLEFVTYKECSDILDQARKSLSKRNGAIVLCCPKSEEDGLARFRSGILPLVQKVDASLTYPILYQKEMATLLVEQGLSGTGSASGEMVVELDVKNSSSPNPKTQEGFIKMLSGAFKLDVSHVEKIAPGMQQQLLKGIAAASGNSGKLSQTLVVFVGRVSYPFKSGSSGALTMTGGSSDSENQKIKLDNQGERSKSEKSNKSKSTSSGISPATIGTLKTSESMSTSNSPIVKEQTLRLSESGESFTHSKLTENSSPAPSEIVSMIQGDMLLGNAMHSTGSNEKLDEQIEIEYTDLPSRECWWIKAKTPTHRLSSAFMMGKSSSSSSNTAKEEFRNYGLDNWQRERSQWLTRTVKDMRPDPPPVPADEVIEGLTKEARTYDLPGPMKLSEVMTLYQDIWDAEEDD